MRRKVKKLILADKNIQRQGRGTHIGIFTSIPRSLRLTERIDKVTIPVPIFLRTGQTEYSYSVSTQTYYLSIAQLVATSTFFTSTIYSTYPLFELMRIYKVDFKWMPSDIIAVTKTFELTPFSLRYIMGNFSDAAFSATISVRPLPVHLECLVQQTNRPQKFTVALPDVSIFNGQEGQIGQWSTVDNFNATPTVIGGILELFTPTAPVNSVATYNPIIGYVQVTAHIALLNSIL